MTLKSLKGRSYKTFISTRVKKYCNIQVINKERTSDNRRIQNSILVSYHKCSPVSISTFVIHFRPVSHEVTFLSILITYSFPSVANKVLTEVSSMSVHVTLGAVVTLSKVMPIVDDTLCVFDYEFPLWYRYWCYYWGFRIDLIGFLFLMWD